jgi:8-oxo-dGTP pyrophosphatase MutT (NUDIX family)
MASDVSDQPIPAATVVVMRDVPGGAPELLMLERSQAMAFAGGALVFPGGRIDPGDHVLAADEEGTAKVAAVREAIEEAGVAIGVTPSPDARAIATMRAALHGGAAMAEALAGRKLALDALVPFARWLPRGVAHRVFDTHFFLAQLPDDAPAPSVDATENSRLFWMSATDVLAEAAAGRAKIIFPTRLNLERLSLYGSCADAVADAARYPIRTITPWVEARGGVDQLCIPDDLGYPVTSEPVARAART